MEMTTVVAPQVNTERRTLNRRLQARTEDDIIIGITRLDSRSFRFRAGRSIEPLILRHVLTGFVFANVATFGRYDITTATSRTAEFLYPFDFAPGIFLQIEMAGCPSRWTRAQVHSLSFSVSLFIGIFVLQISTELAPWVSRCTPRNCWHFHHPGDRSIAIARLRRPRIRMASELGP
jgi:hypothetical protein